MLETGNYTCTIKIIKTVQLRNKNVQYYLIGRIYNKERRCLHYCGQPPSIDFCLVTDTLTSILYKYSVG